MVGVPSLIDLQEMAGQLQGSGLLPPYTGVDKQYLLHRNASLFCELQDSLPQFYQNIRIRQVYVRGLDSDHLCSVL